MYGVVLWSDGGSDRTLIWCEDHGDLAFSKGRDEAVEDGLRTGDVVRFDMVEDGELRIARNVRLIAAEEYPTLADTLLDNKGSRPVGKSGGGTIVPFSPPRAAGAPRVETRGSRQRL